MVAAVFTRTSVCLQCFERYPYICKFNTKDFLISHSTIFLTISVESLFVFYLSLTVPAPHTHTYHLPMETNFSLIINLFHINVKILQL